MINHQESLIILFISLSICIITRCWWNDYTGLRWACVCGGNDVSIWVEAVMNTDVFVDRSLLASLVLVLRLQRRLVCVWLLCGRLASLTLFLAFVMRCFWSTVYPQVWAIVLHWRLLLTALPSCRLLFPNQLAIRTFILERNVRIFKCLFPYPVLVWDQIYFSKTPCV